MLARRVGAFHLTLGVLWLRVSKFKLYSMTGRPAISAIESEDPLWLPLKAFWSNSEFQAGISVEMRAEYLLGGKGGAQELRHVSGLHQ